MTVSTKDMLAVSFQIKHLELELIAIDYPLWEEAQDTHLKNRPGQQSLELFN